MTSVLSHCLCVYDRLCSRLCVASCSRRPSRSTVTLTASWSSFKVTLRTSATSVSMTPSRRVCWITCPWCFTLQPPSASTNRSGIYWTYLYYLYYYYCFADHLSDLVVGQVCVSVCPTALLPTGRCHMMNFPIEKSPYQKSLTTRYYYWPAYT